MYFTCFKKPDRPDKVQPVNFDQHATNGQPANIQNKQPAEAIGGEFMAEGLASRDSQEVILRLSNSEPSVAKANKQ